MKILVIGLGSIGQRHLTNILNLGYTNVSYVSSKEEIRNSYPTLNGYQNLDIALKSDYFNIAIICTPTATHTNNLKQLLIHKVKMIYIEKPISHQLKGLADIQKLIKEQNTYIRVGFDLHFDPGLIFVKNLLQKKHIGELLSFNAFVGQYLPDWRPKEDYRKGMSASKSTGGGVMLDLIHEFDYIRWLIGNPIKVACMYRTTGSLEIETEDVADVILQYESGLTGTIHMDYLQRNLLRNCLFTGTKGNIKWDLSKNEVQYNTADGNNNVYTYKNFNRNDRFVEIMNAFLTKSDDDRLTTFEDGVASLKIVTSAKTSSENSTFENINYSFL